MATVKEPACVGMINREEGQFLRSVAMDVLPPAAIVEIGSHSGLSTCWMGHGSASGMGAQVFAIDPWLGPRPDSNDDPFGLGDGVYAEFLKNVKAEGLQRVITPMRMRSVAAANKWKGAIGLLFIDAVHETWAVTEDYNAWWKFIEKGGTLAFHDYWQDPECTILSEVGHFIHDVVIPSNLWDEGRLVHSTWSAVRL